jgi:hypothetical protein
MSGRGWGARTADPYVGDGRMRLGLREPRRRTRRGRGRGPGRGSQLRPETFVGGWSSRISGSPEPLFGVSLRKRCYPGTGPNPQNRSTGTRRAVEDVAIRLRDHGALGHCRPVFDSVRFPLTEWVNSGDGGPGVQARGPTSNGLTRCRSTAESAGRGAALAFLLVLSYHPVGW